MYENLRHFMIEKNLPFEGDFVADGQIHRYSAKNNGSLDEWYSLICFEDGHFFCNFGSWRSSAEFHNTFKSWTTLENEIYEPRALEASQKAEQALAEEMAKGVKNAKILWQNAKICVSHPYLTKKKINPNGTKIHENNLIVPVYDDAGEIISLQKIDHEGNKKFLANTSVKFGRFGLGEIKDKIFVAEGFATGASIYEATGEAVAIAFSASNLHRVGHDLTRKYPSKMVALCQDLGKAGDESAEKWIRLVNSNVFKPDFKNQKSEKNKDFNDLFIAFGKAEVLEQLSPQLNLLSLDKILRTEKVLEWSVPNFLLKGSLNLIYGSAGAGKSAFVHALGFAISQGVPFGWYKPTKQKVLFIDGELTIGEMKSRFERILETLSSEFELDLTTINFLLSQEIYETQKGYININDKKWQLILDKIIKDFDVIIFDNLSTLSFPPSGASEDFENKAASWEPIGCWLRFWKSQNKTMIFVHHSAKSGTYRGSSKIAVEMSLVLSLLPVPVNDPDYNDTVLSMKIVYEKAREVEAKWKKPYEAKITKKHQTELPKYKWSFKSIEM